MSWRAIRRRRRKAGAGGTSGCLGGRPNDTTNERTSQQRVVHTAFNGHIDRLVDYHAAALAIGCKRACRTLIDSLVAKRARAISIGTLL